MSLSARSTAVTIKKWSIQRSSVKAKGKKGFHRPSMPYASHRIAVGWRLPPSAKKRASTKSAGVLSCHTCPEQVSRYNPGDPCLLEVVTRSLFCPLLSSWLFSSPYFCFPSLLSPLLLGFLLSPPPFWVMSVVK